MHRLSVLIITILAIALGRTIAAESPSENGKLNSTNTQLSTNEGLILRVLQDPGTSDTDKSDQFTQALAEKKRFVFAHIVQGNYQSYSDQDWLADINLAKKGGIDAFAINIGQDATNEHQLPLVYDIAAQNSFSVFLSFDMNYYNKAGSSSIVTRLIQTYAKKTSQFLYDGKPLVSTFSGEVAGTFLDNNPDYNAAWQALKNQIGFPIYFLPTWTGADPKLSAIDGLLSWDAWSPTSSSPDKANLQKFRAIGKQYAAPLSALFFKHLSSGEGGNYIHPTDSWFVVERYMDIISSLPDFVELVSWNDYGESHYLRDPRPSANLPVEVISSKKYVEGFPHEPLLDMLTYFNQWYKSGSKPTIASSKAYMWYRPHPKDAKATSDPLPYPRFAEQSKDDMQIILLLSSATRLDQIKIQSGTKSYSSTLKDHLVPGSDNTIVKISAPFSAGAEQSLKLFDSTGVLLGQVIGVQIVAQPEIYNFNYWSGMVEF